MRYTYLGNTGVKISRIGLGSFLNFNASISLSEAKYCIDYAHHNGVNFIDTANTYGNGQAEIFIGQAIQDIPRGDLVIATKCFFPMTSIPSNSGLSRKHIFDSVNLSLKNLGVDYIDIFQFHRYDENTPLIESMAAIADLMRLGKILYWGLSRFDLTHLKEIREILKNNPHLPKPVSNQWYYNIFSHDVVDGFISEFKKEQISLISYSPLGQGFITENYKNKINDKNFFAKNIPRFSQKMEKFSDYAKMHDINSTQLALAWVLGNHLIDCTLLGFNGLNQLKANINSEKISLDSRIMLEISKIIGEEN